MRISSSSSRVCSLSSSVQYANSSSNTCFPMSAGHMWEQLYMLLHIVKIRSIAT